jgi:hypothetical protein
VLFLKQKVEEKQSMLNTPIGIMIV